MKGQRERFQQHLTTSFHTHQSLLLLSNLSSAARHALEDQLRVAWSTARLAKRYTSSSAIAMVQR
jgi:hypothetical protein